jgi:hypothetical protein
MSDDAYRVNRSRSAGAGDNGARELLNNRPVMRLYARTVELESIQDARNRHRWRRRWLHGRCTIY